MKNTHILSLILALILAVSLLAGCAAKEETPEPAVETTSAEAAPVAPAAPEAPAAAEPSGEPAAPPAEGDVPTAEGDYSLGLIRDGVAQAELNIPSGKVVDVALNYAGKDSTVSFTVDSVSDETVCTAVADILTVTISGAKAGTSVVTASWTAVNTSGSRDDNNLNANA